MPSIRTGRNGPGKCCHRGLRTGSTPNSIPIRKGTWAPGARPEFAGWDRPVGEVLEEAGLASEAVALGAGHNASYGTDQHDLSALMMFHTISFAIHQANWPDAGGAAKGGNQRIPEAMARNLTGDVLLNSPVAAIADEGGRVRITLDDGRRLHAARAVIAVPFSALRRIALDPRTARRAEGGDRQPRLYALHADSLRGEANPIGNRTAWRPACGRTRCPGGSWR